MKETILFGRVSSTIEWGRIFIGGREKWVDPQFSSTLRGSFLTLRTLLMQCSSKHTRDLEVLLLRKIMKAKASSRWHV